MKIIRGIKNGAVLQRAKDGRCDIVFEAKARGDIACDCGRIETLGEGRFRLSGIPSGGPYSLTLSDPDGAESFAEIYVGDLWLLAGQSNMEGAGLRRAADIEYDSRPERNVRAYYLDDRWDAARSQLHQQWLNTDEGVREKYLGMNTRFLEIYGSFDHEAASGVGPGIYIARRMYELTGVPQGVIPCAMGATGMTDWDPDRTLPDSLYRSMIRRANDCGGNIRGVFWYQGEGETNPEGIRSFYDNMTRFVGAIRRDLGDIPFVQAQIGHTTLPQCSNTDAEEGWQRIRELQRLMPSVIPNTSTVSTANSFLQDLIHIDAQSHEELGRTMAEEMRRLVCGKGDALPELVSAKVEEHPVKRGFSCIRLNYANIVGGLRSAGRPHGFSITLDDERPYNYPYRYIDTLLLEGDSVVICVEDSYVPLEKVSVWYGAGFSCVCNITDGAGRSLPAFGPVRLSDLTGKSV